MAAEAVLGLALAAPPRLGAGRLVCLDGPAGAGKTTLAGQVVAAAGARGLSVALVHMDDVFEGWSGLATAGPLLLDEIVAPLARGERTAYRRYDWVAGRRAEEVEVPAVDLLVVEGVGSGHPAVAGYRSVLVWVEAPADVRLERGLRRDGAAMEPQWRRWMVEEAQLHRTEGTRDAAEVHVDGTTGGFTTRGAAAV